MMQGSAAGVLSADIKNSGEQNEGISFGQILKGMNRKNAGSEEISFFMGNVLY